MSSSSFLRVGLLLGAAVALAASSQVPSSGLTGERRASSLTADERDQLCAFEGELAEGSGDCDGAGPPPPSDICQDPDRFDDDMDCGYTVADVEACFMARLADPCAPVEDAPECQVIESCECLAPEACLGLGQVP